MTKATIVPKEVRRLKIKTVTIPLHGDYEEWEFVARTNPPLYVFSEVSSGNIDLMIHGLSKIIQSWNFVDEVGEYVGDPSEETIRQQPVDLIGELAKQYTEQLTVVPPA